VRRWDPLAAYRLRHGHLDPATRVPRRRTSSPGELARCRRAAPNSTA
jgi:hypothetical protein